MKFSRRRRPRSSGYAVASQPTLKYTQNLVSRWLINTMETGAEIDSNYFDCLSYANDGLKAIANRLVLIWSDNSRRGVFRGIPMRKRREICDELKETNPKRYASLFEDIWNEQAFFQPVLKEIITDECQKVRHKSIPSEIKQARNNIARYLGCSDELIDFLEFVNILSTISPVEGYFENTLELYKKANIHLLARILDIPVTRMKQILAESYACGFLQDSHGNYFRLSSLMEKLWNADSDTNFDDLIFTKFKGKSLPLDKFHLDKEAIEHTLNMFSVASDETVHILLYGGAGTGKTSFAQSLAKELGVKAWSVASREDDDDNDRRMAMIACTNLAAKHEGAFVLVDEAERLLDTSFGGYGRTKDKAWLNGFLEQSGRRMIWITNHIRHVDRAVRRRFTFSIHFKDLNASQRQFAWEQIIKDERVTSRISQDEIKALVKQYPVSVAVVSKAIRQAKVLKNKKGDFAKTVERVLDAHITLERDGAEKKKISVNADEYTLDGVTLEQSSQHSVNNIMQKMHKIEDIMKQDKLPKGGGSMLFYGPPGTGKSALAQYMAQELGRECVIKKASDLLSPYVGEAEQNIAEAFQSAEQNGDILVIDEADSFIYSRESATRSWEVTQVNEFLTQLEEYKGICICTSNRRKSMDMAAMRRFSFKIAFDYAGKEQLERLYMSILAPLCKQELNAKERNALFSCSQLTPGDFAAVRSQFWLDDDISHTKLIEALMREQKDKLDNAGKMLGFK